MAEYTTIRVTKKNKIELTKIMKKLKKEHGWINQITLNDAICYLIKKK